MHSVYAVENPLVDFIMHEDYEWLARFDAKPGTMQLTEYEKFCRIVKAAGSCTTFPGGSGANTIRALAWLIGPDAGRYGRPAYSGGIGDDEQGRAFVATMEGLSIDTRCAVKDLPTGVSGIVVTPDHERTMFTCLGACQSFSRDDLAIQILDDSRFFYSTGYMWDTELQKDALFNAVEHANRRNIPVCFDLADPFVVDRYFADLAAWIRGRVAVLFANRQELQRMVGSCSGDEEVIRAAGALAPVVVMKTGCDGCLVLDHGKLVSVAGFRVACVDTTGAGDSFAAGFLYGLLLGCDAATCGRLGNKVAATIVATEGCRYDLLDRGEILAVLGA